jgi:hypothetical protein
LNKQNGLAEPNEQQDQQDQQDQTPVTEDRPTTGSPHWKALYATIAQYAKAIKNSR